MRCEECGEKDIYCHHLKDPYNNIIHLECEKSKIFSSKTVSISFCYKCGWSGLAVDKPTLLVVISGQGNVKLKSVCMPTYNRIYSPLNSTDTIIFLEDFNNLQDENSKKALSMAHPQLKVELLSFYVNELLSKNNWESKQVKTLNIPVWED